MNSEKLEIFDLVLKNEQDVGYIYEIVEYYMSQYSIRGDRDRDRE